MNGDIGGMDGDVGRWEVGEEKREGKLQSACKINEKCYSYWLLGNRAAILTL